VNPARDNRFDKHESDTTLGDLLYANKSNAPIPEKDWVRLIRWIAAGDPLALHTLYERTHPIVYTLIVRIINNRETAEELTLDVFYDVWRKASDFDPARGSVVGWIMNQARSKAISRLPVEREDARSAADPLPRPTHVEEQARTLRTALEVLTAEERRAIETTFFLEMNCEEVAVRLDQPVDTVKTQIRFGLGKLREKLSGSR